jgi:hypothetical protein
VVLRRRNVISIVEPEQEPQLLAGAGAEEDAVIKFRLLAPATGQTTEIPYLNFYLQRQQYLNKNHC